MLEPGTPQGPHPAWDQEVTVKMQCVLEDRSVVEKDCKLVFVIGEGDVNQVKALSLCHNVCFCIIESVYYITLVCLCITSHSDR